MKRFIEITDTKGVKHLINIRYIEEVADTNDGYGCWITLAEWEYSSKKQRYIPLCVKTEYVDGERIKADTFYKLINGEFMEVE